MIQLQIRHHLLRAVALIAGLFAGFNTRYHFGSNSAIDGSSPSGLINDVSPTSAVSLPIYKQLPTVQNFTFDTLEQLLDFGSGHYRDLIKSKALATIPTEEITKYLLRANPKSSKSPELPLIRQMYSTLLDKREYDMLKSLVKADKIWRGMSPSEWQKVFDDKNSDILSFFESMATEIPALRDSLKMRQDLAKDRSNRNSLRDTAQTPGAGLSAYQACDEKDKPAFVRSWAYNTPLSCISQIQDFPQEIQPKVIESINYKQLFSSIPVERYRELERGLRPELAVILRAKAKANNRSDLE